MFLDDRYRNDSLDRRDFLRRVVDGAAMLGAVPAFSSLPTFFKNEVLAAKDEGSSNSYKIPNYSYDIAPALKRRSIEIVSGSELEGCGAFKEFCLLRDKNIFGRLFSLEANRGGYFDLMISADGDNPETFAARSSKYESAHPNARLVLQVAGAFSCRGEQCQSSNSNDWEPDGFLMQKGESRGWPSPNSKYGGVVVLSENESPRIFSRNNILLKNGGTTTLEKIVANIPSELAQATIFQAFTLIKEGCPQRFLDTSKVSRRILMERCYFDSLRQLQQGWGILQLDDPQMTLTDIGGFLKEFGVRNAALLNTGSHALGWVRRKTGEPFLLNTPHRDEPTMPNFTNVLVGVAPRAK